MADVDGGRLVRTAVLVEEAELGSDGAAERQQDAESHVRDEGLWSCAAVPRLDLTGLPHLRCGPPVRSPLSSVDGASSLRTVRTARLTSRMARSCTEKPLLLIDVDGVVSLFGFTERPPSGLLHTAVHGIPHFLSTHAASLLARLSQTFACTWPHLTFANEPGVSERHWKLAAIESATGPDRPLAWIDDAFDASCAAWAAARPGPTLLVQTDPATGLREEHVTRLESWARDL